jgi:hypothetical protein
LKLIPLPRFPVFVWMIASSDALPTELRKKAEQLDLRGSLLD